MAAPTGFEAAREVADTVLYEGYLLYPYRASSAKNQVRFQWGVLMPPDVVARDPSERGGSRTEVVVEGRAARLDLLVRFLHVQRRVVQARRTDGFETVATLETDRASYVGWDEATEVERAFSVDLLTQPDTERHQQWRVEIPDEELDELIMQDDAVVGRLLRTRLSLRFSVSARVRRPITPYGVQLVTVDVENLTPESAASGTRRDEWLLRSLAATHLLLGVDGGRFVSQLDPPEWAKGYVAGCRSDGTFPVLLGPSGTGAMMLSSPIILYDHPRIAPESRSSFMDGLEIDELLSLRTLTLSEGEKREMRGTDPRAAELLDQVEGLGPELMDRLHGSVHYLETMTRAGGIGPAATETGSEEVPWWDPGSDAAVDPETDTVTVAGVEVGRGSRVILRPGTRPADAFDLFLAGREATVAGVFHDVDSGQHLAVTVDDDPGADLKDAQGRYLYFAPDEVEPLGDRTVGGA